MSTYLCVVAVNVEADDVEESLLEIGARAADALLKVLINDGAVLHMAEHSTPARARLMAVLDSCLTVSLS